MLDFNYIEENLLYKYLNSLVDWLNGISLRACESDLLYRQLIIKFCQFKVDLLDFFVYTIRLYLPIFASADVSAGSGWRF